MARPAGGGRGSASDSAGSRTVRWLLVAAVAGGILVGSVLPPGGAPLDPRGPLGLVAADKWAHAGSYAVLGVAAAVALGFRPDARGVVAVFLGVVGFGLAVEVIQAGVPWRSFALADAAANAVGAGVAVAGWWALDRIRRTHRRGEGDRTEQGEGGG